MKVSSLCVQDDSRTSWDAVVIGAGPAGSVASLQLAKLGAQVLLIDRATFPRNKVCGCCINGNALATLRSLGLLGRVEDAGATPLREMRLAASGTQAAIPLIEGLCLSRAIFDSVLVAAAKEAGVEFLCGCEAIVGENAGEFREVHCGDAKLRAGVIVVADGLHGRSLRGHATTEIAQTSRIGAGATIVSAPSFYAPGVVHMAIASAGYVGLVRTEDGQLNIAAAWDREAVKASHGLDVLASTTLKAAGWSRIDGIAEAEWRGTPPLTRRSKPAPLPRVFAAGDAAGYVEPFTGEGIAWALASGAAVAPWAFQASRAWHASLGNGWTRTHAVLIASRQRACRVAAAVLRSPWLSWAAVRSLRFAPSLAVPVLRHLNAPTAWTRGPLR